MVASMFCYIIAIIILNLNLVHQELGPSRTLQNHTPVMANCTLEIGIQFSVLGPSTCSPSVQCIALVSVA